MPTRILREGIITSEKVNELSPGAELFYRRSMSVIDDYGRYFAHPSLLRAACYALQLERVSEADVKRWLSECTALGLMRVYGHGKYVELANFRQQTRSPSKFPEPQAEELLSNSEAKSKRMRSESESESESKTYTKAKADSVTPDAQAFIKGWCENFKSELRVDYKFEGSRDGKAVKLLLRKGILIIDLLDISKKAWRLPGFNGKQSQTIHGFNQYFNQIQVEVTNGNINGFNGKTGIGAGAQNHRNAGVSRGPANQTPYAEVIRRRQAQAMVGEVASAENGPPPGAAPA